MLPFAARRKTSWSLPLSWLVVVGIALPWAPEASGQGVGASASRDRAGELQQLADDLAHQIGNLQRFDRPAAEAIYFRLGKAIDAWEAAGRTDDDFRKMEQWLQQALAATMPGARRPVPSLPAFSPRASVAVAQPSGPPAPSHRPDSRGDASLDRSAAPQGDAVAMSPQPEPVAAAPRPTPQSSRPPVRETPELPPQQSVWARHPAARPADLGNPFTDDPVENQRTSAEQVVLRPRTPQPRSARADMHVNLAALQARTRGFNRGLGALEAKLVASPAMAPEQLLLLTMELKELSSQRELVEMHLESLPAELASRASQPASLDDVKQLVEARVRQLRSESRPSSLLDDVFSEQESPALDEIEKLLQQI